MSAPGESLHWVWLDFFRTMARSEGYFLENLIFLGTALATFLIVSWLILRLILGFIQRCNDSIMAEVRLSAGMRQGCGHNDDKLYHSLLKVLEPYMGDNFKNRSVSLVTRQLQNGTEEYDFVSPPGYGVHYITYKTSWIRVERRQQPEVLCNKIPFEFITLSTYKWNKKLIYDLLAEAKEIQRETDPKRTGFYTISYGDWMPLGQPKRKRQIESVITAEGVKERILQDVHEFLRSEEWYMDRGIPYRRGYLLHGPPGTGKSSLIRAIAGEIGYDICILSLSSKDLTDDDLNRLMNVTPEKCIILLEDVDAAFKSRDSGDSDEASTSHLAYEGSSSSKVTFRGLLNALDGVASTEGRILFVTTNHIEKLDPALIRSGRVDCRVHIDYPTVHQIERMFTKFYPKAKADLKDTFIHILMGMEKKISMAAIQGLFLMFKKDPEEAIQHAEEFLNHDYFNGTTATISDGGGPNDE